REPVAVTFAENDAVRRLTAAGEDCYGELGGRTPANPSTYRRKAAFEADVSRRAVLADGDTHRDAAGWADRRAVVVGVSLLPVFHAVSLARERDSHLAWSHSRSGNAAQNLRTGLPYRAIRPLCFPGRRGVPDS